MSIKELIDREKQRLMVDASIQTTPSETGGVLFKVSFHTNLTDMVKENIRRTPIKFENNSFVYKGTRLTPSDLILKWYHDKVIGICHARDQPVNIKSIVPIQGKRDINIEVVADLGRIDIETLKKYIVYFFEAISSLKTNISIFVRSYMSIWGKYKVPESVNDAVIKALLTRLNLDEIASEPYNTPEFIASVCIKDNPKNTTFDSIPVGEPFMVVSEFLTTIYRVERGFGLYRGSIAVKNEDKTVNILLGCTAFAGETMFTFHSIEGRFETSENVQGVVIKLKDM